jgi:hypothetical protein
MSYVPYQYAKAIADRFLNLLSDRGITPPNRSGTEHEMLALVDLLEIWRDLVRIKGKTGETGNHYPLRMTFEGKSFADRQFDINLATFSGETIGAFLQIELPSRPTRKPATFDAIVVPAPTFGEFYSQIVTLLQRLDVEGGLFIGDPSRQILRDYYWSGTGGIIPVTDVKSAKAAMDLIMSQGEGAWTPPTEREPVSASR